MVQSHAIKRSTLDSSNHSGHSGYSNSSGPEGFSYPEEGPPHLRDDKRVEVDVDKKILHTSWHPSSSTVAVAGQSCLYLYEC